MSFKFPPHEASRAGASPWVIAALFLVIWAVATIHISPINPGGDMAAKWEMVRHLTDPKGWPQWLVDHHTVRWAINFPTAMIVSIFGPSLAVYYGVTITIFAVTVCLLWIIWERMFGIAGAIVLLLVFAFNPLNVWLYTSFLPDNWSLPYLLLAFFFLQRPSSANECLGAAALFLSYAVKVTNLFFAPGILVWLLYRRGLRNALRFGAILFSLFAVESLILSLVLGRFLPLGVVQAAMGTHVKGIHRDYTGYNWLDTITRWAPDGTMFVYTKAIMIVFIFISLVLAIRFLLRRNVNLPVGLELAIWMGSSFAFFISFAALSIEPFRPVQPLLDRYLWPLWPFALTVTFWAASRCVLLVAPETARQAAHRLQAIILNSQLVQFSAVVLIGAALLAGSSAHAYRKMTAHRNNIPYPFSFFSADKYYESIYRATSSCRAVVFWHPGTMRTLDAFVSPKGGPHWSSNLETDEMPRAEFVKRYVPQLAGVTDEHEGTGSNLIIAYRQGCRPDLCAALVIGELAYAERSNCKPK